MIRLREINNAAAGNSDKVLSFQLIHALFQPLRSFQTDSIDMALPAADADNILLFQNLQPFSLRAGNHLRRVFLQQFQYRWTSGVIAAVWMTAIGSLQLSSITASVFIALLPFHSYCRKSMTSFHYHGIIGRILDINGQKGVLP